MITDPQIKASIIPFEKYKNLSKIQSEKVRELSLTLEEKVLEEFNEKYAIVRTSTTHILVQKSSFHFELDSRHSLLQFHENDFFENSEGKSKNKARFWLKHPKRRTFEDIIFDPTRPGNHDGKFNIFKGFSVQPVQGDCSLYWNHVEQVICSGNPEHYRYIRKKMACIIQKPNLLGTAIVLRGLQGTGKNKFVEYFGKIFGPHFMTVTNLEHITGKFNNHLKYAYLLHANEALWGGNKKESGALKGLITDPTIVIEGKGKDAICVDNCRHLIVSSNEEWAVPVDLDDRRFFVLNVSSHRKEDIDYFQALDEQMMQQRGVEALLFDLLQEDLTGFDPRKMPPNDFGFDMKMQSANSGVRFIFEFLKEGRINIGLDEPADVFGTIEVNRFYFLYEVWCEREGLRKIGKSGLGRELKKLLNLTKTRPGTDGLRPRSYEFPPLEECQKRFEQYTKQSPSIWQD